MSGFIRTHLTLPHNGCAGLRSHSKVPVFQYVAASPTFGSAGNFKNRHSSGYEAVSHFGVNSHILDDQCY